MPFAVVKRIKPGYMGVVITDNGISFLCLPQDTKNKAKSKIRKYFWDERIKFISTLGMANDILESLEDYFQRKIRTFEFPLDLERGTDFERSAWEITRTIPYGETRNYKWVAEKCGNAKACRAVGNALGNNPIPILVPCHRVIRTDGGMGGFGAGIQWKRELLELEKGGKR